MVIRPGRRETVDSKGRHFQRVSQHMANYDTMTGRRPWEYFNLGQEMDASERQTKKPHIEAMTQWPELGGMCEAAAWLHGPGCRASLRGSPNGQVME